VRTFDHLQYALKLGSDIITVPFGILKEWGEKGLPLPGDDYIYSAVGLQPVPYREYDLTRGWHDFDISHDLTVKGMEKFSADWNALIG
jgi:transaldolase